MLCIQRDSVYMAEIKWTRFFVGFCFVINIFIVGFRAELVIDLQYVGFVELFTVCFFVQSCSVHRALCPGEDCLHLLGTWRGST